MGLYDRAYGRESTPWDRVENPRSMTVTIIVITVVVYLVDLIFSSFNGVGVRESQLAPFAAINDETLLRPWLWFQFLTYGFLHDLRNIWHIAFNMFGLYIFGRFVERRLGQMEFLRFYLIAIVIGGVVGALESYIRLVTAGIGGATIGASGAVVATVILFACYYPNEKVLLFFVLPVKAWVMAVGFVLFDVFGALGQYMGSESTTAFSVHLAGAGFAGAYFLQGWSLKWLDLEQIGDAPRRFRDRSRRMKLKIHDPDQKARREADDADRILEKIHRHGESSLTAKERKTLERYSRRQREKRGQSGS